MNRTALRETVFKVLFRYEFHDSESFASQMNLFFAEYPESGDEEENWPALDSKSAEEITGKVTDILCHIDEIDIDRIGKAELSIMRIAVYEILYDDNIENAVSISEAVKLAKKYGDEKAYGFVNGVLAKIVK